MRSKYPWGRKSKPKDLLLYEKGIISTKECLKIVHLKKYLCFLAKRDRQTIPGSQDLHVLGVLAHGERGLECAEQGVDEDGPVLQHKYRVLFIRQSHADLNQS